ncbi:MAG TPA: HypC/HybG/HupF family hydrogenase formation chaperone [Streptosporangiaceae bacterium]|jgi:hydrogenase maturation factor
MTIPLAQPGTGGDQPAGECPDGTCITCSDAAVRGTVVRLLPAALALVDTGSGIEEVSIALVSAAVGDTVLVHAREAIAVVPADSGTAGRPGA